MNPLSQLRDIHMPADIGYWPLAIGWIILIVVGLLISSGGIYLFVRRWISHRAKREMLTLLDQLQYQYSYEKNASVTARELSVLLKRAALSQYPREEVAGLQSEGWLLFLDKTGKTTVFSQGIGRMLVTAPYQDQADYSVPELFEIIRSWANVAMTRGGKHHV
jgi:hypothetical protein